MRVAARVIRQFHDDAESVTLAKVLILPEVPTMGTRLGLPGEGVEGPLTVVGVTLRAISDGPEAPAARGPVFRVRANVRCALVFVSRSQAEGTRGSLARLGDAVPDLAVYLKWVAALRGHLTSDSAQSDQRVDP